MQKTKKKKVTIYIRVSTLDKLETHLNDNIHNKSSFTDIAIEEKLANIRRYSEIYGK